MTYFIANTDPAGTAAGHAAGRAIVTMGNLGESYELLSMRVGRHRSYASPSR